MGDGTNTVWSEGGNTKITSGDGGNFIVTHDGDDYIKVGDGFNFIEAGEGRNKIYAGKGENYITTGDGDDTINVKGRDNTINAGGGRNSITAGDGNTNVKTEDGNDTIKLGDGLNTVEDKGGNNRISVGDGWAVIETGDGKDDIRAGDGGFIISTGDGDKKISAGDGEIEVFAGNGNNTISLGDGENEVHSGDGNNKITVGDGSSFIYVGDGNNSIRTGDSNNQITTGNGNNKISAGDGYNEISTGDGRDDIRVGDGDSEISAGAGNDKIRTGDGNNTVYGGDGNDTIQTGDGDDKIWGGQGNDKITGGDGYDIAYYAGSFSDYILERSSSRIEITSVGTDVPDAGSDQLSGIEAIYFQADGYLLDLTWEGDPTLVDDNVTASDEGPLIISLSILLDNDEGLGDRLPALEVSEYSSLGIRVTYDGETITYNADDVLQYLGEGEEFEDSFTYTITDPYGETFEAQVNVTLDGKNSDPTAVDDLLVNEETAATTVDASDEIVVNQDTPGRQTNSSITSFDDGSYFVVWQTNANVFDDTNGAIRGRFFSASGVPTGQELDISQVTDIRQTDPDVAALSNGNYVVTWISDSGVNPTPWTVKARVLQSDGVWATDEFVINDDTVQYRYSPLVVGLEGGGFAVTWEGGQWVNSKFEMDVAVSVFDASGHQVGDQITLETPEGIKEYSPSIAALPDGGFVITRMTGGEMNAYNITVSFFDETGSLVSTQAITDNAFVDLEAFESIKNYFPSVTVGPDGQTLVVWSTNVLGDSESSGYFAQIFSEVGGTVVEQFRLADIPTTGYFDIATTWLDDGRFVVTWNEDAGLAVRAQVFNPDGSENSNAFTVEVTSTGGTYNPDITALSDGRFAITWTGEFLSETKEADIAVRIFDVNGDITSSAYTDEDSPATIDIAELLLNDTDPEGDAFIFSLDTGISEHGATVTYDAVAGTLTYDATLAEEIQALNTGQALEDTFTYSISDGHGGTDQATVTIVVGGVNEDESSAFAQELALPAADDFWG
ncbi:Ig-like domain-containing protein [Parasedimentitalea psychrophila]|uniref:Ig-like domain-containing protein n=1 Tax=Parasedimentitalea psychrophila TaxID=2997337 RepID=A0A9Y2P0A8_9RHOB|nr:Ig-like domain-containing protein [Parasedimentitalea psychrophila]WIY24421.1 Ig-like domain-containing protein [Parasedimentitalea psychrophila]